LIRRFILVIWMELKGHREREHQNWSPRGILAQGRVFYESKLYKEKTLFSIVSRTSSGAEVPNPLSEVYPTI
jgi:hypothetical protein